jgi:hypothetical protein
VKVTFRLSQGQPRNKMLDRLEAPSIIRTVFCCMGDTPLSLDLTCALYRTLFDATDDMPRKVSEALIRLAELDFVVIETQP